MPEVDDQPRAAPPDRDHRDAQDNGPDPIAPRPIARARELSAFKAHLPAMLPEHEGQFVLIRGDEVVGFYATEEDATRDAYRTGGLGPFFVQRVSLDEPMLHLAPGL